MNTVVNINDYKEKKGADENELFTKEKVDEALKIIEEADIQTLMRTMSGKETDLPREIAKARYDEYITASNYIRKLIEAYSECTGRY